MPSRPPWSVALARLAALVALVTLGIAPVVRAGAVEAPTVAVLPLQKASASAQFDGLGRALAGMVVSDLSTLAGIRLVERDQLDALIAEMKLSDTGFLDPKTAQRLGSGVGARFVVIGAFTVVEPTFALDARIVEVRTGEIVKAADAHGTVADFVAVEKELVETLVDGLDLTLTSSERRNLMVQAPTERFSAFSAYGEGLAKVEQGEVEQARSAFARALADDPAFAEARAALASLEGALRERKGEHEQATRSARDALFAEVLANVPEDRARPAKFTYDLESLAQFALRLGVLEDRGDACDRHAEMRHYLARVEWRIPDSRRGAFDPNQLALVVAKMAEADGLDAFTEWQGVPTHLEGPLSRRSAAPFESTGAFVLGHGQGSEPTHGLVTSLVACYPPDAALTELDRLLAEAKAANAASAPWDRMRPDSTVADGIQVAWLFTRADAFGPSDELTRRTDAMVASHRGAPGERAVLALADEVLARAKAFEAHRVLRRGLAGDEVVRLMRLVGDGKVAATPMCQGYRPAAASWLAAYERDLSETPPDPLALGRRLDGAFATWAAASDLGCVQGVAARFAGPTAAWAYLDAARTREIPAAGPGCLANWLGFEQLRDNNKASRQDRTYGPPALSAAYAAWLNLVAAGCALD